MPGPGQHHGVAVGLQLGLLHRHHEAGTGPASTVLDDGDAVGPAGRGLLQAMGMPRRQPGSSPRRFTLAPGHGDATHPGEPGFPPLGPGGVGLQPHAWVVVASLEGGSAGFALAAALQAAPPVGQGLIQTPERLLQATPFSGSTPASGAVAAAASVPADRANSERIN